jgi:hypothetical protein
LPFSGAARPSAPPDREPAATPPATTVDRRPDHPGRGDAGSPPCLDTYRSRWSVWSPASGGATVSDGDRPNILVIWGDDIGITNLSCYSDGLMGYRTPNIDGSPTRACGSPTPTASRAAPLGGRRSSPAADRPKRPTHPRIIERSGDPVSLAVAILIVVAVRRRPPHHPDLNPAPAPRHPSASTLDVLAATADPGDRAGSRAPDPASRPCRTPRPRRAAAGASDDMSDTDPWTSLA